ncbi:retroviral-like aspartic protease family protein [Roseomonas sp. 18066]|uniref:retroviral-like aspartic protease family protein n=1 Tax=Roseomonas sp. 18066 TaxID=2681412 RepID=UPI0013584F54|nr:retroviral-like aspartic protease family protein [Roseomonas sp. 18066]
MLRLASLASLALLAGCAGAAPPPATARAPQPECVFTDAALVPLLGASGLAVAGSINGEPLRFDVNTGLGITALLPGVANRLGLPADPRRQSSFGDSGGVAQRNLLARSVAAAGQEWSDRSLAVRNFRSEGDAPFDVMLASDLLRETELEFDLPGRRVGLHRRQNCQGGGPGWTPAASLPVVLAEHNVPVVSVRLNGQPVRAALQSGNNRTMLSQRAAERLGLLQHAVRGATTRASGTRAETVRGQEYIIRKFALGGVVLRDFPVVVERDAGSEEMVLGHDWMRGQRVWLSYAGRRLFIGSP